MQKQQVYTKMMQITWKKGCSKHCSAVGLFNGSYVQSYLNQVYGSRACTWNNIRKINWQNLLQEEIDAKISKKDQPV